MTRNTRTDWHADILLPTHTQKTNVRPIRALKAKHTSYIATQANGWLRYPLNFWMRKRAVLRVDTHEADARLAIVKLRYPETLHEKLDAGRRGTKNLYIRATFRINAKVDACVRSFTRYVRNSIVLDIRNSNRTHSGYVHYMYIFIVGIIHCSE